MKSFFTILCFFNMLNACTINFVDNIGGLVHGRIMISSDIDKSQRYNGKPVNVDFLNEHFQSIGNSTACWKHCNRRSKHRSYNVCAEHIVKKENLGEFEYQICVFGTTGRHEFDMHVFRSPRSENYEISFFRGKQDHCAFMDTFLKDKAVCCTFPDNGLIEILQSYE